MLNTSRYMFLLLIVLLLLTALACSNSSSGGPGGNTTSATVSIDVKTPSQAQSKAAQKFLGTFTDVTSVTVDVLKGGTSIITGQHLTYSNGVWSGTLSNLPIGPSLTFIGHAYNASAVQIFTGTTVQAMTGNNDSVGILMAPVSDGVPAMFPKITAILVSAQIVTLNTMTIGILLEASSGETLTYAATAAAGGGSFSPSSGTITLAGTTGTLVLSYTAPSTAGTYTHSIRVTNSQSNWVQASFSTVVVAATSSASLSVQFSPVITSIGAERSGSDVTFTATVSDTTPASLTYSWGFDGGLTFADNATNPAVLQGYDETKSGNLTLTVTNGVGAATTVSYYIAPGLLPDKLQNTMTIVSAQIQTARNTADGSGLSLPIDGAIVTYVKPAIGNDAAGFFLQDEQQGPAIFISVDPATLSPSPIAGDKVNLVITSLATIAGVKQANAISGYTLMSQGNSTAALLQDLTDTTDIVSNVGNYESELISLANIVIAQPFGASGTGFVSAQIDTAGVTSNSAFVLRVPSTLQADLELSQGCSLTLNGTPLWRNNSLVQPSAWVSSNIFVTSCPAPKVISAAASGITTVVVTFDRTIDAGSVSGNGSQFTFTGGLTGSAAIPSGKTVTVTTSTQAALVSYSVSVAGSVVDSRGKGVDATANSASFLGYATPAVLVLNEVNPNILSSHDLIELKVISGGNTAGMVIQQNVASPVTLATLPVLSVAAGDFIVVHLNPAAGVVTEIAAKSDCTDTACYGSAWDIAGGTTGITFSSRILLVKTASGTIQDAVPFTNAIVPASFDGDLLAIQTSGLWLPADCGGSACSSTSTPTAEEISVDWTSVGTTSSGNSVQRTGTSDTNTKTDWVIGAPSFGSAN